MGVHITSLKGYTMKKLLSMLVSSAVFALPLATFTAPASATMTVHAQADKKDMGEKKAKAKGKKAAKKKMAKKAA
jgi:Ni/Co efflux regulator RcnB